MTSMLTRLTKKSVAKPKVDVAKLKEKEVIVSLPEPHGQITLLAKENEPFGAVRDRAVKSFPAADSKKHYVLKSMFSHELYLDSDIIGEVLAEDFAQKGPLEVLLDEGERPSSSSKGLWGRKKSTVREEVQKIEGKMSSADLDAVGSQEDSVSENGKEMLEKLKFQNDRLNKMLEEKETLLATLIAENEKLKAENKVLESRAKREEMQSRRRNRSGKTEENIDVATLASSTAVSELLGGGLSKPGSSGGKSAEPSVSASVLAEDSKDAEGSVVGPLPEIGASFSETLSQATRDKRAARKMRRGTSADKSAPVEIRILSPAEEQKMKEEMEFLKEVELEEARMERVPVSIISLEEDSPFFRRKLDTKELCAEALSNEHLKQIVQYGSNVCYTGSEFSKACGNLASELMRSWDDVENVDERNLSVSLQSSFKELGRMVLDVKQFLEMLTFAMENVFVKPIDDFRAKCSKRINKSATSLHKACETYENALSKFMQTRPDRPIARSIASELSRTPSTSTITFADLMDKLKQYRERYEQARFEHTELLNEVLVMNKLELVEQIVASIYAFTTFFHSGHELTHAMQPYAKKVQLLASKRRTMYDNSKKTAKTTYTQARESRARPDDDAAARRRSSMPSAEALSAVAGSLSLGAPVLKKSGYLFKKSSGYKKDWKRRWFSIEDGQLVYYRGADKEFVPELVANVALCSVRPVDDPERMYCFEVVSPTKRAYMLQAESELELISWLEVIRNCTEHLLFSGPEGLKTEAKDSKEPRIASPESKPKDDALDALIKKVRAKNSKCADCSQADPDWALINLGAVVCLDCSGVHRGLGVAVSKVRSFALDTWDSEVVNLLDAIGNTTVNAIYEERIDASMLSKLNPGDPAAEREEFIREKYVNKTFVSRELGSVNFQEEAEAAVKKDDVLALLRLVASGVKLKEIKSAEYGTLLHLAAANGSLLAIEFLSQNGVRCGEKNAEGQIPADVADKTGQVKAAALLRKKL